MTPPTPSRILYLALDDRFAFGKSIIQGVFQYLKEHQLHYAIEYPRINELNGSKIFKNESNPSRVRGIIAHLYNHRYLEDLRQTGLPVINVSNFGEQKMFSQVISDDYRAGQMAADYFLGRGYVHFAYLGIPTHRYSELRGQGFSDRLAEKGFKVFEMAPMSGHESVKEILQKVGHLPQPLALFCANDLRAFRAILACQHLGFRVPEEIAILGVDNEVSRAHTFATSLSSIVLGTERMGYLAAQMIDHYHETDHQPAQEILVPPVKVIQRRSTDALQQQNPDLRKVLEIIQDRFTEPLRVEDLPGLCGLSRRTIERLFQVHLRSTPHAEILRHRVNLARQQLLTTNDKMEKIAAECGFSSPRELYNAIRRSTGLSPSVFRKTNLPKLTQGKNGQLLPA